MEGSKEKPKKENEADFLKTVRRRLKIANKAYSDNRSQSIEDLKFLNGDQWDDDERQIRKNRKRPMLIINMLPEKVDEVVGDMRQNRARIKIRPMSMDATDEVAKVREGIIRQIEYDSNAQAIYDYAGGRMSECGFGTWRYYTQYCEDNPFVQEIRMALIKNSFSVMLDPTAKQPNKSDAKWGFIASKMYRDDFEEKYPGKTIPSSSDMDWGEGITDEYWFDEKSVLVCEYFEVHGVSKSKCLMKNGVVMDKEDAEKEIQEWEKKYSQQAINPGQPAPSSSPSILLNAGGQGAPPPSSKDTNQGDAGMSDDGGTPSEGAIPSPPSAPPTPKPPMPMAAPMGGLPAMPPMMGMPMSMMAPPPPKPEILDTRTTEVKQVFRWVLTTTEVLEDKVRIPGKYIPIVEITGKERDIEGKTSYRGIVRDGKDPQRLVNYWNTSAAEVVALAPKAPWVGTAKQFEGYETDYANANVDSLPFLKYNPDPKAAAPPMRQHAGEPPVAMFAQIDRAEHNLHRVVGIGMDMKEAAPDASQKALIQRRKPTELSTFVFIDNLAQGIAFGGRILNEMIPEVYDTERDVPIRKEDDTESFIPINMSAEMAAKAIETNPERYNAIDIAKLRSIMLQRGKNFRFNDIGVGKYSVVVDLGPSYATQRQEAADNFVKLAQTNPKLWDSHGDLIVEQLDIAGAPKFAARYKKIIPPYLLDRKPTDPPPVQKPIPPQVQLVQAKTRTEMIKQQKEVLKTKVELLRMYKETKETDKEVRKTIIDVLAELHGQNHFADKLINPGGGGPSENMEGQV